MDIPKKYFQDRTILFLLSVNAFLMFAVVALVVFNLGIGKTEHIVQCRDCSNPSVVARTYIRGNIYNIVAFIFYAVGLTLFNAYITTRLFRINRQLSVIVLAFTTLLLTIAFTVSYYLLLQK